MHRATEEKHNAPASAPDVSSPAITVQQAPYALLDLNQQAGNSAVARLVESGRAQSPVGITVQREPVAGQAPTGHDDLVEQYRRDRGLPPGGADATGQQVGPTNGQIAHSDDFADWLRHGDVAAPGARPGLAPVPQVLDPRACPPLQTPSGAVTPQSAAAHLSCRNHCDYVNMLSQIAANLSANPSPYGPAIGSLYRALLVPVISAGPSQYPAAGSSKVYTIGQQTLQVSARTSVVVPDFTLRLIAGGRANGQYNAPRSIDLYESSVSALSSDVADVERTAYHEMIHFFHEVFRYQPLIPTGAIVTGQQRREFDLNRYESFRSQFVTSATPFMTAFVAEATRLGVPNNYAHRPNSGAELAAGALFGAALGEGLARIEEEVYLRLRNGQGFPRADVRTLPQTWLRRVAYWPISDPAMQSFVDGHATEVDTRILPAVQAFQEAYLDARPAH
jgi:hypothetical protein